MSYHVDPYSTWELSRPKRVGVGEYVKISTALMSAYFPTHFYGCVCPYCDRERADKDRTCPGCGATEKAGYTVIHTPDGRTERVRP